MNEYTKKFNQTQENLIDVMFNLSEEFSGMTYEEIRGYSDIIDKCSTIVKRMGETLILNVAIPSEQKVDKKDEAIEKSGEIE